MTELTKSTLPPKERNPEAYRVVETAMRKGCTWAFSEDPKTGVHTITVRGANRQYIHDNAKALAPNGKVVGFDGDDGLIIAWEKAALVGPAPEETKPKGALPDDKVMASLPRIVESSNELAAACKRASELIEQAYPGVKIGPSGYGLGKADLLCRVLDHLFQVTGRSVDRAGSVAFIALAPHLQGDTKGLTLPPAAGTYRR